MELSNNIQERNTAISGLSVKRNRDEWRRLMREDKTRKGLYRYIWMDGLLDVVFSER